MNENQKLKIEAIHDPSRGWVCSLCGAVFKTKQAFLGHRSWHVIRMKQSSKTSNNNKNNNISDVSPYIPKNIVYDDYNNLLPILLKCYEQKIFALIIGPKGVGKTTLVRKFAEVVGKPLYTVNFSLRTRESHLIGFTAIENGNTKFAMGVIPKSMREGAILYLDELNAAEADVLIRLDEALDDRRELNIKEAGELITVKAHPDWFVIATINPLSHIGTKELPPQLLSRFPARIYLDYPPKDVELRIISHHVDGLSDLDVEEVSKAIDLANKLRDMARAEEIYYSPSLRETITFAKLLKTGLKPKEVAEIVFANAYWQWGEIAYRSVKNLIISFWGE